MIKKMEGDDGDGDDNDDDILVMMYQWGWMPGVNSERPGFHLGFQIWQQFSQFFQD